MTNCEKSVMTLCDGANAEGPFMVHMHNSIEHS